LYCHLKTRQKTEKRVEKFKQPFFANFQIPSSTPLHISRKEFDPDSIQYIIDITCSNTPCPFIFFVTHSSFPILFISFFSIISVICQKKLLYLFKARLLFRCVLFCQNKYIGVLLFFNTYFGQL
jgi:hypothetical protein